MERTLTFFVFLNVFLVYPKASTLKMGGVTLPKRFLVQKTRTTIYPPKLRWSKNPLLYLQYGITQLFLKVKLIARGKIIREIAAKAPKLSGTKNKQSSSINAPHCSEVCFSNCYQSSFVGVQQWNSSRRKKRSGSELDSLHQGVYFL